MIDSEVALAYLNIGLSIVLTGLALLMLRSFKHGRIRGPFFWVLASAGAFTTHTLAYHLSEVFFLFPYGGAELLNNIGHASALLLLVIGMFQLARIWGKPPRRLVVAQAEKRAMSQVPVPATTMKTKLAEGEQQWMAKSNSD